MSLADVSELPDSARAWIFGADRSPGPSETGRLLDAVSRFLQSWTAHSRELRAALAWREHRFLVVALDEGRVPASGCSIDALVGRLRELGEELSLDLLDGGRVWFSDAEGRTRAVSREAFRRLAEEGEVGPGTTVYDLTADRLGEIRSGEWKRPAAQSWHAELLPQTRNEPAG